MITFTCPCGKKLQVPDDAIGKTAKCPNCGQKERVPGLPVSSMKTAARPGDVTMEFSAEAATLPPSHAAPVTRDSVGALQETVGGRLHATDGADSLTSFLSAPESAGELGRLGGFKILKILGHGGMGVVYLAEDPKLRRKVAIKALLPHLANSTSSRQRFLREAQSAAALEHDNIVPILHVGEDRGVPFIVMPLLKGQSLDARLKCNLPVPVSFIVQVGIQVADALGAAHDRRLLHRDIKPGNIWLENSREPGVEGREPQGASALDSFRVKILDFGLARLTQAENAEHLTQSGAILGTPGYMAPEQVDGEDLDGRADLFSLGCVLYRMATGKPAFPGNTVTARLLAVCRVKPVEPNQINPEISRRLSGFIMRLLAKKREDRFASAQEVAERLRALDVKSDRPSVTRSSSDKTSPRSANAKKARRSPGRKRLAWVIAVGFVLTLGTASFVVYSRFGDSIPTSHVTVSGKNKDLTDSSKALPKDPPTGWHVYHSAKWGYSIWLPGIPSESEKKKMDFPDLQNPPAVAAPLVGGSLKFDGDLNADRPFICYVVRLEAGKAYQIDMTSPDTKNFDPYLTLLSAEGKRIAADDDGGGSLNARLFFEPKESSPYQIVAHTYSGQSQGSFTLDIMEVALTPEQKLAAEKAAKNSPVVTHEVKLNDNGSGMFFHVACADSNRIFPNVDDALNKSRDGGVNGVKGILLSETRVTLGIHPGRDFRVGLPDKKGLVVRSRIFLVGRILYQLHVIGPQTTVEGPAADVFFRSFRLDREF